MIRNAISHVQFRPKGEQEDWKDFILWNRAKEGGINFIMEVNFSELKNLTDEIIEEYINEIIKNPQYHDVLEQLKQSGLNLLQDNGKINKYFHFTNLPRPLEDINLLKEENERLKREITELREAGARRRNPRISLKTLFGTKTKRTHRNKSVCPICLCVYKKPTPSHKPIKLPKS